MKKLFVLLALTVMIVPTVFSQADTLTILHVNDTHSCLSSLAPRGGNLQGTHGGIARAASIIGATRMTEENVLTLHGGDMFVGDLFFNAFFGVPELRIMHTLGFDAMGVGNHEFDLQPETLLGVLDTAFATGGFPLVSSNVNMELFPPLKNHIKPFILRQIGDIKVGLFGLTTPETNVFSLPAPVYIDTDIVPIIISMVDTLSRLDCDIIVCLSHLGMYFDQDIAAQIPGINIIVSSHDHSMISAPIEITNPLGGTTYIVQAGSFYENIGKMKVKIENSQVSLISYELICLDSTIPEEPMTLAVINQLIGEIENTYGPVYSQQIGTSIGFFRETADSLLTIGNHDTPLGNLITDAFRWKTNTQIAIEVGGSTSQPLHPGPIVFADVFRSIGYGFNTVNGLGFRILKFKLSGLDLIKGLEFGLSMIEANDELLPQVSGMKYVYNPNNPAGSRIVSVQINNQPIDLGQLYSVTTNEFLFSALTDTNFVGVVPIDPYMYEDSTEAQIVAEFISTQGNISPAVEGRVYSEQSLVGIKENNESPAGYYLGQNYPNPFNPVTTIEYMMGERQSVRLSVIDILGSEVAVLVHEEKSPGVHQAEWDAGTMASGVYFYRIQTPSFTETRKMMLLR